MSLQDKYPNPVLLSSHVHAQEPCKEFTELTICVSSRVTPPLTRGSLGERSIFLGSRTHRTESLSLIWWVAVMLSSFLLWSLSKLTLNVCLSLNYWRRLAKILWNLAFSWVYLSFSPLPFASLLFSALLRQPLCLLEFLFLGDGFGHCLLYKVMDLCP